MAANLAVQFLTSRKDDDKDAGQELLDLLKDPFAGTLAAASIYSALGISLGFTAFVAISFSLLRPFNQAVYAPRLKHADEKHAPPAIGKAPWSWVTVLFKVREDALVEQAGMDAAIFLRFVRMCRNMFLVLAVIGVSILIPVNYTKSKDFGETKSKNSEWTLKITPLNVFGSNTWVQVVVAYLFDFIIMGFLWWNYRKVMQLRRKYFESEEYQNSLHSRTLMLSDIPKSSCSDEGIARIIDEVVPNSSFARTAVARNVKDLPSIIAEHDRTVRQLEKVLAKYLKNPAQLPPGRPMCKPSKKDRSYDTYPRGQKVDAIEYLTQRIRDLEMETKEVRAGVDKRSVMPYGFASYTDISEAHSIAYSMRSKKPQGATVTLAPRPNDIIWANMAMTIGARNRRKWINALWVILLTVLWIAPNAMIAIFLVNLSNLGKVWKGFQNSLSANPQVWGVVQGIASPALTSLVYLVLPIIFRRLSIKAGDTTKTGRERHVLGKLFAFFIFNNLIVFSLFSTIWNYVAGVIDKTSDWRDIEQVADTLFSSLCLNSPFWITYLLQRQLGAAIDLSQIWTLIYASCLKKFSSPTPRELIELTAPPPFDYASYYNYFLYYATVTLCFAGIQPLTLVATGMYFAIDSYLKKYLLLYVFVTKTESGGVYWRVLFNRLIFGAILANFFVLLTTWVRGDGTHFQFYAVCPLPFILIGFKIYCSSVFDAKCRFYSTRNVTKHPESGLQKGGGRSERLASRFGNPALYKPLITPMVHQKAQNLLPAVYKGRLTDGREAGSGDLMSVSGYSDMYALDAMQGGKPGKAAGGVPGFEYVSENHMDFEYYKNRSEFADEHGGGDIYQMARPGTPGSFGEGSDPYNSRPGTPGSGRASPFGPGNHRRVMTGGSEMGYEAFRPPVTGFTQQPTMGPARSQSPMYAHDNNSASALVRNAAGFAAPGAPSRDQSVERGRMGSPMRVPVASPPAGPTIGALGGGPQGYSGLAQADDGDIPDSDPAHYDYFRAGTRNRRAPGEGW